MSKKIKLNKKLHVALPLKKLNEGDICYISSDYLFLVYKDEIEPEEHQFIISKRASYIKFPSSSFDLKVAKINGELVVDEDIFYAKNAILKPIPDVFYDMKYYFYAQKINYTYFTKKLRKRMSFPMCIDELLMLSDSAYTHGTLQQDDQEQFDYLLGWGESKMPVWANKLSFVNIIKEIESFKEDLYEIHQPYTEEHIEEKDYHPCDLAMVVFITEILEALNEKVLILIKNTPKLILELGIEEQKKLVLLFQLDEKWEILAAIRDIGVKLSD